MPTFQELLSGIGENLDAQNQAVLTQISNLGTRIKALEDHTEIPVYWNTEQSYTATCGEGFSGNPKIVTIEKNTISSTISQQDSDDRALLKAKADALEQIVCIKNPVDPTLFFNTEQTFTAKCPQGTNGGDVTRVIAAGTISSLVSIDDANSQALAKAKTDATASLVCTPIIITPPVYSKRFYNTRQEYTAKALPNFQCDDVAKVVGEKTLMSCISQEDADNAALYQAELAAKAVVYRKMEMIDPTVEEGWNASWSTGSMKKGSADVVLDRPLKSASVSEKLTVQITEFSTIGPEDQWPYTIYPTVKSLETANEPNDKYVGVLEDGRVYRKDHEGDNWSLFDTKWNPYMSNIQPHSISAFTILKISEDKLTITLEKPTKVDLTNAKVYIDNTDIFNEWVKTKETVKVPKGKFYVSWVIEGPFRGINKVISGSGWDDTFIQSPMGCSSVSIRMNNYHSGFGQPGNWDYVPAREPVLSDITIIGNLGDFGYRLQERDEDGYRINDTAPMDNPFILNQAVNMSSYNGKIKNVRVVDGMGYNFEAVGKGIEIDTIETLHTTGHRGYIGWGGTHGGGDQSQGDVIPFSAKNIVFYSPILMRGMELTKCQVSTMENVVSFNGAFASNGSSDSAFKKCRIYVASDSFNPAFSTSPVLIVNGLQEGSSKITLEDIEISQAGYPDQPGFMGLPMLLRSIICVGTNNIDLTRITIVRPDMQEILVPGDFISNGESGILCDGADNVNIKDSIIYGSYPEMYHRPEMRNPHVASISIIGGVTTASAINCSGGDDDGDGGIFRKDKTVVSINNHFTTMD